MENSMRLFAFAKIFKPLGLAALLINPGFAQVIGTSPSADKARGVVVRVALRVSSNKNANPGFGRAAP